MSTTYNQILTRGTKSALASTSVADGKIRFVTDSQQLFIDFGTSRIEITDVVKGYTDSQIKSLSSPLDKFYFASDTHFVYYRSGSEWIKLNVSDNPVFEEASTRVNINTGESFSTLFGKIKKWFSDLKALAFKDSIDVNDIDETEGLDFGDEDANA